MTPIRMPHTNRILIAPKNWDISKGECKELPISDYEGVIYSYWKPTLKERVKILLGYKIRLCVASSIHPPVHIDTEKD